MKRRPPPENSRRVRYIDGNSRFVITNKTGKTVQCESFQERKLALLLERDPTVLDYRSQPEPLHYTSADGKEKTYTPDFHVKRLHAPDEIYEVTLSERQETNQSLREREVIAKQIYSKQGWVYRVFTEVVLPDDSETSNLLAFYASRSKRCADATVTGLAQDLLGNERMAMADLIHHIMMKSQLPRGKVHMALRYQIWHGMLEIDWKQLFYQTTAWTGKTLSASAYVWCEENLNE